MEDIDHKFTRDIVCPYCGEKVSKSWEYPDKDNIECGKCGKQFSCQRTISITYVSKPIE